MFRLFRKSQSKALSEQELEDAIFTWFPHFDEVFSFGQEGFKKFLWPLCTLDLSKVNKKWSGLVHLIYYYDDPYTQERQVEKCYNDLNGLQKIGFMLKGNKYKLTTNLSYFDMSQDWKEYFESARDAFTDTINYVKKNELVNLSEIKIGGKPEWIQGDETPEYKGNKMDFVAQFSAYNIADTGVFYLFYSPLDDVCVQLYQVD